MLFCHMWQKSKFHFCHILLNCIELNFNKIEFHVRTHFWESWVSKRGYISCDRNFVTTNQVATSIIDQSPLQINQPPLPLPLEIHHDAKLSSIACQRPIRARGWQTLVYIPNIALAYHLTFTYDLWDYPQPKLLDTMCFGQKIMFPS